MACDDRQLTEAQRVAGYQNQRTGVQRAIRPFTGRPTLDNLIDYINRELTPAVRQSRDAVNDIYLQVADNAPSGNPLAFYFSTETGAADPTAGRIRLDASPQNTATTLRISQTNARLVDVAPWLDVMAGSSTTPLGVVTLSDAINPGRAIRFDLNTMVDQGDYWDLGVAVIESTHPDPFVEDEAVVLAFIPGVASTGTTVPPSALTPIAAQSVLGNPTSSTAAPVAIALNDLSVLGRAGVLGTNVAGIDVPGTGTFTGESVFLRVASTRLGIQWRPWTLVDMPEMGTARFVGNVSGATARPAYTSFGDLNSNSITFEFTGETFIREALFGDVVALQNDNETTIQPDVVTDTKLRDSGPLSVIGRAANSIGDPADISAVAASGAVLRESGSVLGFGTIATAGLADDSVTNAKLANMAQSTFKGRAEGAGTGDPQDLTPTQAVAIIDGENATWTGVHSFTGASHTVNVAGAANTTAGAASTIRTTAGDLTVLSADDVFMTAQADVVINAGDTAGGVAIHAGVTPKTGANDNRVTISADDQVVLEPTGSCRIFTGGVERVEYEATGAWQISGAVGTVGHTIVTAGAGASPAWGQLPTAGIADDAATNAKLANMAQSTVKGRAVGAGTGDPQDLTAAQVRAIVDSAPIAEVEETGAGPFNDYAPATAGARHIMASNAAGVFTGLSATNYVVGDWVIFSHQGTGYTEFQHNTGSAVGNVFFTGRQGRNLRIFDNELAVFRYVDTVSGATTITRWELQSPLFPWAQSSADAAGDVIAHNGTNYVAVAGGNSADVVLRGNATFGTVSLAAMANLAAGTVIGRQIDAGTGVPVALTGLEVAELLRYGTTQAVTLAATTNDQTLNADTTVLRLTSTTGAQTLTGLTGGAQGRLVFVENVGADGNPITLASLDAGSATANRFRTPRGLPVVLGFRDSALLRWETNNNDWRVVAALGQPFTDGDKGHIVVSANGATWLWDTTVAITGAQTITTTTDFTFGVGEDWIATAQADVVINAGDTAGGVAIHAGLTPKTAANDNRVTITADDQVVLEPTGSCRIFTAGVERLEIENDGAWQLAGDTGTSGFAMVCGGASAGPTWTTIGTTGLTDDGVTNAKLRNSAAVSVIGRSANSTGDPADIAAGANDRLLARTSDSLAFQQLSDGMVPTNTIALTKLANILDNRFLGNISGATGAVTATDFGSLNSTSIIYESTGKTLIRQALTGDVTAPQNSNATTIANDAVTLAKMADLAQSRIIGRAEGAGTGDPTALTPAQVVAIIDGEAITWTGSHTFNGANFTVTASADVGITASGGTVTLAANTQVQITSPTRLASSTALDSVGSTAATGTVDNLTINSVSAVRFTGPPAALSGMVPVVDGQVVLMINAAATDMGVLLESTSSTAANRFAGSGTSRNIKPGEMALAWYDGASDRWRLLCRDDADL